PRLSERTKSGEVHLRVDLRRVHRAMPEHLADLAQGGALAQHPGGETVAQQMRAFDGRTQSGPREGAPDNGAHRTRTGEASARSLGTQEDPPSRIARTIPVHVGRKRL